MTNLLLASAVDGATITTFQDDGTLARLLSSRLKVSDENLALIFPSVAESALVDYIRIRIILESFMHQVSDLVNAQPFKVEVVQKRVVDLTLLEKTIPSSRNWTQDDYQMVELSKRVPQAEDPELAQLEAGISSLHTFYTVGALHTPCILKNLEYKAPELDPAGAPIDLAAPNTVAPVEEAATATQEPALSQS